jgi:hypothetical protein
MQVLPGIRRSASVAAQQEGDQADHGERGDNCRQYRSSALAHGLFPLLLAMLATRLRNALFPVKRSQVWLSA